jgi:UDP:flavonoid glycosyltransferase YjiC (YdhE family)
MHEQEFNMQRVVDLGVGIQLSEKRFKESDLIDATAKILNDSSFRQSAELFVNEFAQYPGVSLGCDAVDKFIGTFS